MALTDPGQQRPVWALCEPLTRQLRTHPTRRAPPPRSLVGVAGARRPTEASSARQALKRLPSPPAAPARHLVDRAACALPRWRSGSLWHRGRAWSARGARDHQGEVAAAVHLAVLAAPARCRCCCARGCASRSFGRGRSRGRGPLSALDESAGGRSASSGRVGAEAASCRSLALSGGIDEHEPGARPRASVRGPARGSRRAAGSRVASGRAETCGDRVCRTCYDSRRRPRCATRPAPLTRVSKCVSV